MKNLIKEELNRINYLLNYDSKKTSVENEQKVNYDFLFEAGRPPRIVTPKVIKPKNVQAAISDIKDIGAKKITRRGATTDYLDIAKKDGTTVRVYSVQDMVSKWDKLDDFAKLDITTRILKSRNVPWTKKTQMARAITSSKKFDDTYSKLSKGSAISKLKRAGYDDDTAKQIYDMYRARKAMTKGKNPKYFNELGKWIKNNPKKSLLIAAGVVGAIAMLFTDDDAPFPQCLKGLTKKTDQQIIDDLKTADYEFIKIETTGISELDVQGGGIFYQGDGETGGFKTGDERYEGEWEFDGDEIIVTLGEQDYTIPCQAQAPTPIVTDDGKKKDEEQTNPVQPPKPELAPVEKPTVKCGSFPLPLGCVDTTGRIKKLQDCLDIPKTGIFDDDTAVTLNITNGKLDSTTYDKEIKKCEYRKQGMISSTN